MADGSTGEVGLLVEGEDYYLDHGLMVLTARYHLRRGCCCAQHCRHCPFAELSKESTDAESNDTTR